MALHPAPCRWRRKAAGDRGRSCGHRQACRGDSVLRLRRPPPARALPQRGPVPGGRSGKGHRPWTLASPGPAGEPAAVRLCGCGTDPRVQVNREAEREGKSPLWGGVFAALEQPGAKRTPRSRAPGAGWAKGRVPGRDTGAARRVAVPPPKGGSPSSMRGHMYVQLGETLGLADTRK